MFYEHKNSFKTYGWRWNGSHKPEHKKIAHSELNGLGLAGFLNPDTNSAEIPSNLKKLRIMIDKKMTGEQIIEKFGNEHTIKVAKTLGLIKEVEESAWPSMIKFGLNVLQILIIFLLRPLVP